MKIALLLIGVILVGLLVIWQFALSRRDRMLIFASPLQLNVAGHDREFYVNPPISGVTPKRLFIGLHAYGDNAKRFGYYTGLHNVVGADDLVIYPNAVPPKADQKTGWNSGYCCGSGWKQGVDDAKFIASIAEKFKAEYDAPVYLVGFSNGGMMTQRMIAEQPGVFDGGVVSGSSAGVDGGNRLSPTGGDDRLLLMHGRRDQTVLFNGGAAPNEPEFPWLSFDETTTIWRDAIGENLQTHVYDDLTHQWPDWRIFKLWKQEPEGTRRAVQFLMRDSVE